MRAPKGSIVVESLVHRVVLLGGGETLGCGPSGKSLSLGGVPWKVVLMVSFGSSLDTLYFLLLV
jgi:hypothetical protein